MSAESCNDNANNLSSAANSSFSISVNVNAKPVPNHDVSKWVAWSATDMGRYRHMSS